MSHACDYDADHVHWALLEAAEMRLGGVRDVDMTMDAACHHLI